MTEAAIEQPTDSGDSESFDMEGGVNSLASDLFGKEASSESDDTDDQDLDLEASEDQTDETSEKKEPEVSTRTPPSSWKKDMHEKFSALPADVQEYIEQREDQMKNGLSINKEDSDMGRSVRDIMAPYKEVLDKANVPPEHMIKSLMAAHYKLTTSTPEEKSRIMAQLAHSYGVNLADENVIAQSRNINPEVQQLQNEINQLKYQLNTQNEKARQAKSDEVTKQINDFADSHEHFNEVAEEVATFVEAGLTLEQAYEKAIWANPIIRQKMLDAQEQDRIDALNKAKMEKVRSAKKAKSVNVESRETSKSPTGFLGSMEDTMRDALRDIENRT